MFCLRRVLVLYFFKINGTWFDISHNSYSMSKYYLQLLYVLYACIIL